MSVTMATRKIHKKTLKVSVCKLSEELSHCPTMFISLLEAPEILTLLRQHDKKLSSRFSGTAKKGFYVLWKIVLDSFP